MRDGQEATMLTDVIATLEDACYIGSGMEIVVRLGD